MEPPMIKNATARATNAFARLGLPAIGLTAVISCAAAPTDDAAADQSSALCSSNGCYADAVLADAPVAYWRLGESGGTTAFDAIGIHPGTYVNGPTLGVA